MWIVLVVWNNFEGSFYMGLINNRNENDFFVLKLNFLINYNFLLIFTIFKINY